MKKVVKAAEIPIGGKYRPFNRTRRSAEGPTVTCVAKGRTRDGQGFNVIVGGPGGQRIPDPHVDRNIVQWLNA